MIPFLRCHPERSDRRERSRSRGVLRASEPAAETLSEVARATESKGLLPGRSIRPSFRRAILSLAIALLLTIPCAFAAERPTVSAEAQTTRYFENIRKDPNLLLAFLLEMPKGGDLHNHLSGAIYAETLVDWAKEQRACVDPKTFYLTPSLKLSTGDPYCPAPAVLAETALANPVLYRGMVDAFSMRNWELSGNRDTITFLTRSTGSAPPRTETPGPCWPKLRPARHHSRKSTRS